MYIHIYLCALYVCICTQICTYVFTYMHAYIHACLLTYSLTYSLNYLLRHIHAHIHTYIHTYILTDLHTYMHACTCAHTYSHIYNAYMHAYIGYIRTRAQISGSVLMYTCISTDTQPKPDNCWLALSCNPKPCKALCIEGELQSKCPKVGISKSATTRSILSPVLTCLHLLPPV